MKLALMLFLVIVQPERFDVLEKTIPELQDAMVRGDVTSVELVRQYLARIEAFDRHGPELNSMLYVNPAVLEQADALDRERRESGSRGPLHGIPVILKDNYDTHDMPTTAGSVALAGHVPDNDGYQVQKLRDAGVVFIGKANMHELAYGITTVSSLGGQTLNPYDPARVPGGSSGGTGAAIAAELAAIGMGSDTCGSIRIPAANNNLFGLRVTQGLSSRAGIVPLALTQDVGGPIARSVVDLAIVLDATVGLDPRDPQTAESAGHVPETYTAFLRDDALEGARLGMVSGFLVDDGPSAEVTRVVREAAARMAEHGAELVEIEIDADELGSALGGASVIAWEVKFDLRDYLAGASDVGVRSLDDILASGLHHEVLTERLRRANEAVEDADELRERLARRPAIRRRLIELFEEHDLDALVYPTLRQEPVRIGDSQSGSSCAPAAHSGLPAFSLPAGFTDAGLPVGIELLGKPFGEGDLIAIAYAYEQKTKPRRLPERTPSLVGDSLSREFVVAGDSVRGKLVLDRPTQTLHYELIFADVLDRELVDIKLALSTTGPIIALFGRERYGSVSIGNAELSALVAGDTELWVFTVSAPAIPVRAAIEPVR